MSLLKGFRKAKKQAEAAPVPRKIDEIQAQYNEVAQRAGQAQYQVYVLEKDLELLNRKLLDINQEAAARNRLDKEAAAEAAKNPPVETSQQ